MDYRFIRSTRTSSTRTKGRFAGLWLPLSLLGAIILFHFFNPTALENVVSRIASPFWKGQRLVENTLVRASLFFTSKQALVRDVETLGAELKRARSLLADRELLLEEYRLLREQFGRTADKKERLIGVILAAPPRSVYDTAVIDIGSEDGVVVGDIALSGSVILGTIGKTFPHTSLVEFFSTAGKETPVLILREGTAIPAEARGEGGGEFRTRLPTGVLFRVGDLVVVPGWSSLVLAAIEAIEGNAADSFQTIRFRTPVPIQSLRFLEIQKSVAEDTP